VTAQAVNHRGPTLGYRIEDGGTTIAYIPDHEPGLGAPLDSVSDEWISGFELARNASLLIHDCQYTDEEYRAHLGWGHCPVSDALAFARRVAARRLLLFHHDPLHSDEFLDGLRDDFCRRWIDCGGDPAKVELATERRELEVEGAPVERPGGPEAKRSVGPEAERSVGPGAERPVGAEAAERVGAAAEEPVAAGSSPLGDALPVAGIGDNG
jgi:hypothetical protein